MVELFISARLFILQSTLGWGECQKELGDQEDRLLIEIPQRDRVPCYTMEPNKKKAQVLGESEQVLAQYSEYTHD